jgi:hypothetical protein
MLVKIDLPKDDPLGGIVAAPVFGRFITDEAVSPGTSTVRVMGRSGSANSGLLHQRAERPHDRERAVKVLNPLSGDEGENRIGLEIAVTRHELPTRVRPSGQNDLSQHRRVGWLQAQEFPDFCGEGDRFGPRRQQARSPDDPLQDPPEFALRSIGRLGKSADGVRQPLVSKRKVGRAKDFSGRLFQGLLQVAPLLANRLKPLPEIDREKAQVYYSAGWYETGLEHANRHVTNFPQDGDGYLDRFDCDPEDATVNPGFTDTDFDKPIVGVANGHSNMNPCNAGIQPLVDRAMAMLKEACTPLAAAEKTALAAARDYLATMEQLLDEGCLGQIPEIVDGDAPHTQRGCDAFQPFRHHVDVQYKQSGQYRKNHGARKQQEDQQRKQMPEFTDRLGHESCRKKRPDPVRIYDAGQCRVCLAAGASAFGVRFVGVSFVGVSSPIPAPTHQPEYFPDQKRQNQDEKHQNHRAKGVLFENRQKVAHSGSAGRNYSLASPDFRK